MCGIYGYQIGEESALTFEEKYTLSAALALLNDRRGGDSWGVAIDGDVVKGLGLASCQRRGSDVFARMAVATTVAGHARFATVGAITPANAHPLRHGRIVGAHNGGVSNHADLGRRYRRDLEVDSHHLLAHIDEGRNLRDVRAYGALEWWPTADPHAIRLCRFNGGQLAAAHIDADLGGGCVWSSSAQHLREALLAAGLADVVTLMTFDDGSVYRVKRGAIRRTRAELGVPARYDSYSWTPSADLPPAPPARGVKRGKMRPSRPSVDATHAGGYRSAVASRRGDLLFGPRAS